MQLFDVYPLQNIRPVRGKGSWIWDDQGKQYLDLYGGHAVISIGHSHPHYLNRVQEQLNTLGFYSNSVHFPIQETLAAQLGALSGKSNYQLFLCNSGAEANENALKLASFHTQRKKVISFQRAFHGRTSLAVAVTDQPSIAAPINQGSEVLFLPYNDLEAVEFAFSQQGSEVAAVILEGIQGVGGIHEASIPFLQGLRRLCNQYQALLIADSVQCGYGRSGHFFAHDWAGIAADIYTTAKGMGNGFPIAGVWIAPHILPRHGMLGSTFGGNPLACAAGLAVAEVIASEQLLENARYIGNYLLESLSALLGPSRVRGRGLMIGLELPAELGPLRERLLYEKGIFTGEAKPNVLRLLPPLNLNQAEADYFLHHFSSLL
ncbi:MAG: aspartate aminotransferase family protein [Chitinophagales bacterium]